MRDIPDLVRSGKLHLTADVGMASFRCQSQSTLRDLNGYPDLPSADLIGSNLRFEIMDTLKMEHLLEENVHPNSRTTDDYDLIQRNATELGYHTNIDIVDAAPLGGGQSRSRAFFITKKATTSTLL